MVLLLIDFIKTRGGARRSAGMLTMIHVIRNYRSEAELGRENRFLVKDFHAMLAWQ